MNIFNNYDIDHLMTIYNILINSLEKDIDDVYKENKENKNQLADENTIENIDFSVK